MLKQRCRKVSVVLACLGWADARPPLSLRGRKPISRLGAALMGFATLNPSYELQINTRRPRADRSAN